MSARTLQSPLGPLTLIGVAGAIIELAWRRAETESDTPLLKAACKELKEYFAGGLKMFSVPLNPTGTAFQKSVWHEMFQIPYGSPLTYSDVAKKPFFITACSRHRMRPQPNTDHHSLSSDRWRKRSFSRLYGCGGTETKSFLLDLQSDHKSLSLS